MGKKSLEFKSKEQQAVAMGGGSLGAASNNPLSLTSLYVRDLETNVSNLQLSDVFNQGGEVVCVCRDITTQRSLGYAYVNFTNPTEISSDDATRSSCRNVEDELREMRLNLLMEIEKRKQAEEALENYQSQWQTLGQQLSLVGLTLPSLPAITDETGERPNLDPAEVLCQQIVIARVVAGSIGRACSRAEVEMEMEPHIESKNFEIARLSDRLQYYEAANREMSQRNQEAVEMARQHRHRRKRRQRWIWGSVGFAVTLGAAALAWSYIPASKPPSHESETTSSRGD